MTDAIAPGHLTRSAIVYVRQSSMGQVRTHLESQRLQYAMKTKIAGLGWTDSNIEVIDDDLGVTANGTAERKGFEHMLARVVLGGVGIIAAREISRFARNSADWQQLIERCRQADTLLLDHETVYDVRRPNDRLMLGIKGSISGYELDLLRVRSRDALWEKARRGELYTCVPVGYVLVADDHLEMTPDERVREALALVFSKFLELGSALRVLRWFEASGLPLPSMSPDGSTLTWGAARLNRVMRFLTNPIYAGAYVYGRRGVRKSGDARAGSRDSIRDPAQWEVFIREHHAGYIDFPTFEKIRLMLRNNKQGYAATRGAGGAAKEGAGLFSGLMRCGRCGRLMRVSYHSKNRCAKYACYRGDGEGAPRCAFNFSGEQPDQLLSAAVAEVLTPWAVEAAERAFVEEQSEVDGREQALARALEQARYEAERARRQYDNSEPENRLVTSTLERRWNLALQQEAEATARLTEHRGATRRQRRGREEFMAMAAGFPELWNSPETDVVLKKRIIRVLIEEIAVEESADQREINLRVHWKGGAHTEYRFVRHRTGFSRLSHPVEVVRAILELTEMCDDRMIAKYLNENGFRRRNGAMWTSDMVGQVRHYRRVLRYDPAKRERDGLLTLNEGAKFLGVSHDALQALAARGEVAHRHPLPVGPYIFRRADLAGQHGDRLRAIVRSRTKRNSLKVPENGRLFDLAHAER